MDGNDTTSVVESADESNDEAGVSTHSATGAAVAPRNEGSRVVGAVSSVMAIP